MNFPSSCRTLGRLAPNTLNLAVDRRLDAPRSMNSFRDLPDMLRRDSQLSGEPAIHAIKKRGLFQFGRRRFNKEIRGQRISAAIGRIQHTFARLGEARVDVRILHRRGRRGLRWFGAVHEGRNCFGEARVDLKRRQRAAEQHTRGATKEVPCLA